MAAEPNTSSTPAVVPVTGAPVSGASAGVSAAVLTLITLAALLNFVDRANLATAGPLLRDELQLTNSQLGILLAAFFWTYTPGQLAAGYLVERYDVRWVLAIGVAAWSLATAATGLVGSFVILLVFRLLLGAGESVMYPAVVQLLAVHATDTQRGKASGLLTAGHAFGPAVATLVGGLLLASFDWRVMFFALGGISLLWVWPWLRYTRNLQSRAPAATRISVPTRELLGTRTLWGMSLGHFTNNYALYLLLSWLPTYLVKVHDYSIADMAAIGTGIYLVYAVSSIGTGVATDWLIKRGINGAILRRRLLIGGVASLAVCFTLAAILGPVGALLALAACAACFGVQATTIVTAVQVFAGPRAAGRWMGIQNFIANLAGVLAPFLTGWLVDRTGSFAPGFALAAGACALGMVAYVVLVPPIRPVQWSRTTG